MRLYGSEYIPESKGPYSHATIINGICYTSGQLPINYETGELSKNNIELSTKYCLDNIERILKSINKERNDVVKCNIYLKDINDYEKMNEVYSSFFKDELPSRTAFEVANLPMGVNIEIEAIIKAE